MTTREGRRGARRSGGIAWRPGSAASVASSVAALSALLALIGVGCSGSERMPETGSTGEGAAMGERQGAGGDVNEPQSRVASAAAAAGEEERLARARARMVDEQLRGRDIDDERVLRAMRRVPRHRFAPEVAPLEAYEDRPHPIGEGQTISQPYIVALMTQLARLEPPCRVLEVGTGSGYQAAVLAELGCTVHSIEIVEPLGKRAERILAETGHADRVHLRIGDGYRGWPEAAPFDAVLVTAAAPRLPEPLLEQLRIGGRLVIPVGGAWQMLEVHLRTEQGFERERVTGVRFVPMTGEVRD